MGMNHRKTPKLKYLIDRVPPGFLVDAKWLKKQAGIDPKSIHEYVERGWLERVVWGVYRRPFPEKTHRHTDTDWQTPLLSLQWIMNRNIHLGGENALNLAGYAHYLPLGYTPRAHVYGDAPSWLKRLPIKTKFVVHNLALFGGNTVGVMDETQYMQSDTQMVDVWRWPLRTSSPERAILEALNEIPSSGAGFDKLSKIFEGLATLRPKLLVQLLKACKSVKVRRLFFVLADYHQHHWRDDIDESRIDFGSGPRALIKGGKLHPTYQICVPYDFHPDAQREESEWMLDT